MMKRTCEVLGEKLELLRNFLENSNFNALRSSDERLAGIIPGYCIIIETKRAMLKLNSLKQLKQGKRL
jgi:hypothetical protein